MELFDADIEPARIGSQIEPPALVVIYTTTRNTKVRKRIMPLRALGWLGVQVCARKLIEAHRPYLANVAIEQIEALVRDLLTPDQIAANEDIMPFSEVDSIDSAEPEAPRPELPPTLSEQADADAIEAARLQAWAQYYAWVQYAQAYAEFYPAAGVGGDEDAPTGGAAHMAELSSQSEDSVASIDETDDAEAEDDASSAAEAVSSPPRAGGSAARRLRALCDAASLQDNGCHTSRRRNDDVDHGPRSVEHVSRHVRSPATPVGLRIRQSRADKVTSMEACLDDACASPGSVLDFRPLSAVS